MRLEGILFYVPWAAKYFVGQNVIILLFIRGLAYTQSTDCRPQGSDSKYVAQNYGANYKRHLIVGVQM